MENQRQAIKFINIPSDKVIVPIFDVSKANFTYIDIDFLDSWKTFINNLNEQYKIDKDHKLFITELSKNYKTVTNNTYNIMLPPYFRGGIIYNFPDLYKANNNQLIKFVEQTKIKLSDILIRTSNKQICVNLKIEPETFVNLDFSNYDWLVEQAKINDNKKIWISIVIWWNYKNDTKIKTLEEKNNFIELIEKYCTPEIYYCNYYIMLFSRIKQLGNLELINWAKKNITNIIWDEDLLSDTPTFSIEKCKGEINNIMFTRELQRRGL